jgi:hypothetical protein
MLSMGPIERDRPRIDPREVRREQVQRLRGLGVRIAELSAETSRRLFERFALEFADPEQAPNLLKQAAGQHEILDLERWTRSDCTRRAIGRGSLRWLTGGKSGVSCVRFERSPRLSALAILVDTLDEAWATSWPGAFVDFESRRALFITIDYEVHQCGLRVGRAPYR